MDKPKMVHCKIFSYVHVAEGVNQMNDFLKILLPEELLETQIVFNNETGFMTGFVFYDQRRFMNENSD